MQKLRRGIATIALLNACADGNFSNKVPMQEPMQRPPQVDCTLPIVRGILREGDPQSRLVFAGVPITVQRNSFGNTPYLSNATTSFSLNNGLGWHGVGEGSYITYIAQNDRPSDMRISLRYRVNESQVMMQAEPDCDLRCSRPVSLAAVISPNEGATIRNQTRSAYQVNLGEFSATENYCMGICIISEGVPTRGPYQEFRIIEEGNPENRWDVHFKIGLVNFYPDRPMEGCVNFDLERVCIRLQSFDLSRRVAQVILRVESDCTIVTPSTR